LKIPLIFYKMSRTLLVVASRKILCEIKKIQLVISNSVPQHQGNQHYMKINWILLELKRGCSGSPKQTAIFFVYGQRPTNRDHVDPSSLVLASHKVEYSDELVSVFGVKQPLRVTVDQIGSLFSSFINP